MSRRVPQRARRLVRRSPVLAVGTLLLAVALAGCSLGGGADDGGEQQAAAVADEPAGGEETPEEAIAGSFVGEVSGAKAFVAVVAEPAAGADGSGAVEVYVSDGETLGERYAGTVSDLTFVATTADGREARGRLRNGGLRGTVELRGGKRVKFVASPPSGAAGFYDVKVSARGDVTGSSAAGLGITGELALGEGKTGTLELVDGKRVELAVTSEAVGDPFRAAEVRVIVLPGGQLKGAGKGRPAAGDGEPNLFIRSV